MCGPEVGYCQHDLELAWNYPVQLCLKSETRECFQGTKNVRYKLPDVLLEGISPFSGILCSEDSTIFMAPITHCF